jgi:hypothetical protein
MGRKASANLWTGLISVAGLGFIAAGASVPSEQTMALGFFLLLASCSVLLGLNWPVRKSMPAPANLVSLRMARSRRRSRA